MWAIVFHSKRLSTSLYLISAIKSFQKLIQLHSSSFHFDKKKKADDESV